MADTVRHGVLLSDFNISNLGGVLANDPEAPAVTVVVAPYGQPVPTMMSPGHDAWTDNPIFAVVWTRPESVIDAYRRQLAQETTGLDQALLQVAEYAAALGQLAGRIPTVLVPSWTSSQPDGGLGMLDLRPGIGHGDLLARMNLALADGCAAHPNIYLLDSQRWIQAGGRAALNPTLWYMAKVPYAPEVFREASRAIKAALRGLAGQARKLVILDLDDTLWGGIVGEVGWSNLRLGGHDPVGEAYADFQAALKTLRRRGILLALVSKNEESVALEAIRRHPEMILREEDFVGRRINWVDKAQNVAEIISDLNLGQNAAVFIDDHPAERARVRDTLPEVLVPDWPADPALFRGALQALRCFDVPSLSREDSARTEMYSAEKRREELRASVGSVQDWLLSLDMRVVLEPLNQGNLARTTQLLNKTNQMNLATRRLTEPELIAWAEAPGHSLLTFRVIDKFGDAGLTGILGLEAADGALQIADFVLSCRVMGRKVEESMLAVAVEQARRLGLRQVMAEHRPTERNLPCRKFFEGSGFKPAGPDRFQWPCGDDYPVPLSIRLERLS